MKKKLQFKESVECIVLIIFFMGFLGMLFCCLFELPQYIKYTFIISGTAFILEALFGREYEEN